MAKGQMRSSKEKKKPKAEHNKGKGKKPPAYLSAQPGPMTVSSVQPAPVKK